MASRSIWPRSGLQSESAPIASLRWRSGCDDPEERVRLNASACVRESRVGPGQFNRSNLESTDGHRWISFDLRVEAHALRQRSDAIVPDSLCNPDLGQIEREAIFPLPATH